jgi:hypothetical protein
MTTVAVRSVACPCGARITQLCTPGGDHLARYLRAEQAGAISRDQLTAAIVTLTILAPHVIIPAAHSEPAPPTEREGVIRVNHAYVHVHPGEPVARLNHHDPASPFAIVDFGGNWYHTSEDPAWCRRVAAAWTHAAELLESATQRDDRGASDPGQRDPAAREARAACPP